MAKGLANLASSNLDTAISYADTQALVKGQEQLRTVEESYVKYMQISTSPVKTFSLAAALKQPEAKAAAGAGPKQVVITALTWLLAPISSSSAGTGSAFSGNAAQRSGSNHAGPGAGAGRGTSRPQGNTHSRPAGGGSRNMAETEVTLVVTR
jgi:hypothetical protein